jgi:hypothetical protein
MEATMRRLLLSLALALTLSAVGASSALAAATVGAQKAPIYGLVDGSTCETGGFPTPQTFGFAVLNTPGDETTVTGEVSLEHAAPNTAYEVGLIESLGVFCLAREAGTITTNRNGNGNLHFTTERSPGSTRFFVNLKTAPEELNTPAVELD